MTQRLRIPSHGGRIPNRNRAKAVPVPRWELREVQTVEHQLYHRETISKSCMLSLAPCNAYVATESEMHGHWEEH